MAADDDDLVSFVRQLRPLQGFRSTEARYREIDELDAAENALNALGILFADLTNRGKGNDPPDCEAVVDGVLVGIECTELVHQRSLRQSLKALKDPSNGPRSYPRGLRYHEWTRDQFNAAARALIAKKDRPTSLKGGPYGRYFLIIYCAEMHIDVATAEAFLADTVFECRLITDAIITFDYHPGSIHPYPAVRISVRASRCHFNMVSYID